VLENAPAVILQATKQLELQQIRQVILHWMVGLMQAIEPSITSNIFPHYKSVRSHSARDMDR